MPPAPTEHRPQKAVDGGYDVPPPGVRVAGVANVAGQHSVIHISSRVADVAGRRTATHTSPRVAGAADVAESTPESHMPPEAGTHHKPETLTRRDVRQVVQSAKISAPMGQIFYWSRLEHVGDLRALLEETGLTLDDLIDKARRVAEGRDVLRLTTLIDLIDKGGGYALSHGDVGARKLRLSR